LLRSPCAKLRLEIGAKEGFNGADAKHGQGQTKDTAGANMTKSKANTE
jgi:hypothetical protein